MYRYMLLPACLCFETVIFTGDPQQLGPYVSDVPPFIVPFGFQSMLSYLPLLKVNPPYHVVLNQTYRFHPAITTCLSDAIYGNAMVCAVGADERAALTKSGVLLLPSPKFPSSSYTKVILMKGK